MNECEKKEKDGNVVLLLIIAIITMVIVAVGATFAYLASNLETEKIQNVKASTNGSSDLLLFNVPNELNLYVKQGEDLCAQWDDTCLDKDDASESVAASVIYHSSELGKSIDYTLSLLVNEGDNNFEYTSGKCTISEVDVTSTFNNKLLCDVNCPAGDDSCWEASEDPELVLYLYGESSDATKCNSGDVKGVGLSKNYFSKEAGVTDDDRVIKGYTTECNGGDDDCVWYDSPYHYVKGSTLITDGSLKDSVAGRCFELKKVVDITDVGKGTNTSNQVSKKLYEGSIQQNASDVNKSSSNYYIASISMINYDHDQVQNGDKSFSGLLLFEMNNEGE